MKTYIKVLLVFGLLSQNTLWGQWKKVAQPYQDKMNYYSAAKAYKKVLDTGNTEDFLNYTRVLYSQGQYRETYENYKYLNQKKPLKNAFDLQAFRSSCAILTSESLPAFDSLYESQFITAEIKGFKDGIYTLNHEFTFQYACFNSEQFEDISTFMVDSQLFFISSRPSVNGDLGDYDYNNQPFYDVFAVQGCNVRLVNGKYAKMLPKGVNTIFHDGPAYFSQKSGMFFITRNLKNAKGTMPMGIFYSVKGASGWSELKELPINNLNYTVQHPYFDDSTQTLYFSSNMNGGLGGFDLYKMKLTGGTWSEAQNLGSDINTTLNEVFPYIHKNNLYFSSDGYKGLGGLDIFMANEVSVFQIPGFNTPWDDFGLMFLNDTVGYLSSNRNFGFGKDDILKFNLKKQLPGFVKAYAKEGGNKWGEPVATSLIMTVVDAYTGNPIETPKVRLTVVNKLSGLKSELIVSDDSLDLLLGYFGKDSIFNISVTVSHPDYLTNNFDFNEIIASNGGKIDLGKLKMDHRSDVRRKSKYPKVKPIYFDLDKYYIRKDAALTLDSVILVLKEFPDARVEIRSFTDSRASDSYNKRLSENRAKSTFKYLVKRGISPKRLIFAGYGELGLVNDCGDDKICIEKLHQENRRSELTLID